MLDSVWRETNIYVPLQENIDSLKWLEKGSLTVYPTVAL